MGSGVCQYFVLHLPYQTGTATSSPDRISTVPDYKGLWGKGKMKKNEETNLLKQLQQETKDPKT